MTEDSTYWWDVIYPHSLEDYICKQVFMEEKSLEQVCLDFAVTMHSVKIMVERRYPAYKEKMIQRSRQLSGVAATPTGCTRP